MNPGNKIHISSKEPRLKRARFGNVKDFQGRRQYGDDSFESTFFNQHDCFREGTMTSDSTFTNDLQSFTPLPTLSPPASTLPYPRFSQASVFTSSLAENKPNIVSGSSGKFSFDSHMSQWAGDFNKPLVTPSTNVEFDMPYCYSEEFYSKVSAKGFLMQPFGSIGEPASSAMFNAQLDEWQEKSQLALKYYRQLCEQRVRMPSQNFVIKNSSPLAQYVVGTELFFGFQNNMLGINNKVMFEEKDKHTMFLVPEQDHNVKPVMPNCTGACDQLKGDGSIFTSSWQN